MADLLRARATAGSVVFMLLALSPALAQSVYYCADDRNDRIEPLPYPCPAGYRRTWKEEYDAWRVRVQSPTYCLRLADMKPFIANTRYCPGDTQPITESDYRKFLQIERNYR